MPRRCANWLDTFMAWTLPRSEAPESYIFWTGLFTLSSVLKRKVKIPKDVLGSWECPPHMYVLFIAGPGESRKTTTMSYAIDLLDFLPDIKKGPMIVTQASLLDKLVESDDASVYLIAEEFSDLIMKSKGEMFEFLTSMFDGKKTIEASTISRGVQFADKPCVNLLGATTPVWVAENMSEAVIGGGFASRVIFIFEESIRRRQLIYKGKIKYKDLNIARDDLVEDLKHIDTLEGDFDITDEVEEFLDHPLTGWYQIRKPELNRKLKGYHERKPAYLFKVAMLLHIAKSDSLLLDMDDIRESLSVLEMIEKKLPRVFEGVGKNPHTFDMRHILEYVRESGKVGKEDLLIHFTAAAPPSMLNELVSALLTMKQIKAEVVEGKVYYTAMG